MKTLNLLKEFSELPGPSGYETRISERLREIWQPLADELDLDRVGSLAALKNGHGKKPRSKIMLAAHMDEIGLMVTKIEANSDDRSGFLRVTSVGGVDRRQIYGQIVIVHGSASSKRDLVGVIGSLPGRMLPSKRRNKTYRYDDLVVDVGLSGAELKEYVSVGDFVSFQQPLRKLLNKRVTGKAFDNRVSIVVVTKSLEILSRRDHEWDIVAVATAQEETALLGAYTSAFTHEPDIAIAVDVTFAKGPGVTESTAYGLGDGPTIGIGPNTHPGLHQALRDCADKLEMKVHVEPHARMSGTDAMGLQIARKGIPTGMVSVPIRYMHSSIETVSLIDLKRAARLIAEFIAELDGGFLAEMSRKLMEK